MTQTLIIEKRGEIRRMVERRFGAQLALESAFTFTAARERLAIAHFDIIIWELTGPTAHASQASSEAFQGISFDQAG